MDSFFSSWSLSLFLTIGWIVMTFIISKSTVEAYAPVYRPSPWALAHATFYGDESASATMGKVSFLFFTSIL